MKKGLLPLIFVIALAAAGCKSVVYPVSYFTYVEVENSELAWGRAHAYLSNVFIKPEIEYSNQYIIKAGKIRVTREIDSTKIVIRVSSHEYVKLEAGEISDDGKGNMIVLNELLLDMMEYIKNGRSEYMFTTDRLEMKEKLKMRKGTVNLR
jgi:hypothetical protein